MSTNLMTILVGLGGAAISMLHTELLRADMLWTPARRRRRLANGELLTICGIAAAAETLRPHDVWALRESIARKHSLNPRSLLDNSELRNDLQVRIHQSGLGGTHVDKRLRAIGSIERRDPKRAREEDRRPRLARRRDFALAAAIGLLASVGFSLWAARSSTVQGQWWLLPLAASFVAAFVSLRTASRIGEIDSAVSQRAADEASKAIAAEDRFPGKTDADRSHSSGGATDILALPRRRAEQRLSGGGNSFGAS